MNISDLSHSLERNAPFVVFANVLLQQIGLPVPSVPTMLLAGSLVAAPHQLILLLGLAVGASLVADSLWYAAGRAFGHRVLSGLCRISINPATCVYQTEASFNRWGVWSLLVAKFIPAFSTVAPPIAGTLRMPLLQFVAASAAGAALWAGSALAAGWVLRGAVPNLIATLDSHAASVLMMLLSIGLLCLAWRLWKRRRILKLRAMHHVTVHELLKQLASAKPPVVVDLRSRAMIFDAGGIAGAVITDPAALLQVMSAWPKAQAIVTLCACPQDAGAVIAARRLRDAGYRTARPMLGGWDAWHAAVSQ